MHVFTTSEISAALFQATVTLLLTGLFLFLYLRHRKAHFLWWTVAWALYTLRLGAIISFLGTSTWAWLYWHQVITGWTALVLLWASLVFSRRLLWRPAYALALLFPLVWSYVAIYRLDSFLLAAGPAVGFLSLVTLWTGLVFWRYRRQSGSSAAGFLALTLLLWGLHHLDYPLLRARGAWNPWGYYLDSLFLLAMGAGVLLLVIEEHRQGLFTLSALAGDLLPRDREAALESLLRRPLALRGVRGAAAYQGSPEEPVLAGGVGICREWSGERIPAEIRPLLAETMRTGRVRMRSAPSARADAGRFTAVIPLGGAGSPGGILLAVGDVAAPFTALDEGILLAAGAQIGAALANAELYGTLARRTADLERLSVRMIQQHEDQRRRLERELHDETAQVFSALKMQLGSLRESADPALGPRFARLVELVDTGTRSIRRVTDDLRPAVLDDLGLLPALRALVADFREWSGLEVEVDAPEALPALGGDTELALFRAVQEGLSNVSRHGQAARVRLGLTEGRATLRLTIQDDGVGIPDADLRRLGSGPGRSGLFGMRERIAALGGTVSLASAPGSGLRLDIDVPVASGGAA